MLVLSAGGRSCCRRFSSKKSYVQGGNPAICLYGIEKSELPFLSTSVDDERMMKMEIFSV